MVKLRRLTKKGVAKKKMVVKKKIITTRTSPRPKQKVNYEESSAESSSKALQKNKKEVFEIEDDSEIDEDYDESSDESSSKASKQNEKESLEEEDVSIIEEKQTRTRSSTKQKKPQLKSSNDDMMIEDEKQQAKQNVARRPIVQDYDESSDESSLEASRKNEKKGAEEENDSEDEKPRAVRNLAKRTASQNREKSVVEELEMVDLTPRRTSSRSKTIVNYNESRGGLELHVAQRKEKSVHDELPGSMTDNYTKIKLNKKWCLSEFKIFPPKIQRADIGIYYDALNAHLKTKNPKKRKTKLIKNQVAHARLRRKEHLYPCRYQKYFGQKQYKLGTVPFFLLYCIICSTKLEKNIAYIKKKKHDKLSIDKSNIFIVPQNEMDNTNFLYYNNVTLKFKMREFMEFIKEELELDDSFIYTPGIIMTMEELEQDIHSDFFRLPDAEENYPWVLHMPLCREGMWLNILSIVDKNEKEIEMTPVRVHIPLFQFLVIRGDVLHAGVFGNKGNIRLHVVIKPGGHDATQYFPKNDRHIDPTKLPANEAYAKNIVHITSNDREYENDFFTHHNGCCFDGSVFDNLK